MFRLCCRMIDGGRHTVGEFVYEDGDIRTNRTKKIFAGITEACRKFDLSEPIWLDSNIRDFQKTSHVRFSQDNFVEEIPFRFLDVQVIEED